MIGQYEQNKLSTYAKSSTPHDPVHRPAHYTSGEIECVDAIESALGREQFIGFLRGQVLKYQWRLGKKNDAAEDNNKAIWYASKLRDVLTNPTL
jgi:hypothetical protein